MASYSTDWMNKDAAAESRRGRKMDRKLSEEHFTEATYAGVRNKTAKGQAHWGGEGPSAKRCRHCAHWVPEPGLKMYSIKGLLAKGWCREYIRLSGNKAPGPNFKHTALTCRHFAENPNPPKEFAKPDPMGGGWV